MSIDKIVRFCARCDMIDSEGLVFRIDTQWRRFDTFQ